MVPTAMTDIFPLPSVRYGDLNGDSQKQMLSDLQLDNLNAETLIRLAQETLPMGFKWVVTLAHDNTTNIIRAAFNNVTTTQALANDQYSLKFLEKAEAPFHLRPGLASALAIIDDISIVFTNWRKEGIVALHKELNKLLNEAGLPIEYDKSLEEGRVETERSHLSGTTSTLQIG